MAGTLEDNAELLLTLVNSTSLGTVAGGTIQVTGNTKVTISANATFNFPDGSTVPGARIELEITQDATGSRTGTFTATAGSVLFVGGSKTLTTTAAATDKVSAYSDGTNWLCALNKAYA